MASETIRPDADVAIGSWVDDGDGTTNIYQAIDEATPSDTDYIKSDNNPSASACEIGFGAPTDTVPLYGRLSFRYRKQGARDADLTVQLKKGTQVVRTWTYTALGTSWVQADEVIAAELGGTAWSDIRVVFTGNVTGGGSTTTVQISWSETRTAVVKTIGTAKDYTTIASWESLINNTTYPDALSVAEGQCYNQAFDESVTIDAVATNVIGIVLSVASGERHDGTDGTGARIVRTAAPIPITVSVPDTIIDWLEIDGNGNDVNLGLLRLSHDTTTENTYTRNILLHDVDATSTSWAVGLRSDSTAGAVVANMLVYDIRHSGDTGRDAIGIWSVTSRLLKLANDTVHDVVHSNGAGGEAFCYVLPNDTDTLVKNCIGTDASATTTQKDFNFPGTNPDSDYNWSTDETADDGGGSNNRIGSVHGQASSDVYVSNTAPYDLRLKSGADAIDKGTDLGVTPVGVQFDIEGWDRDSDTPSRDPWDMGAHEFVAAALGVDEMMAAMQPKDTLRVPPQLEAIPYQ